MNLRIVRFYTVGLIGVGVQLGALAILARGIGLHHAISTGVAVEIAVIHNFVWHERWTWACAPSGLWTRFWKFNVSTGLISIAANVAITAALVELCGVPDVMANMAAIAATSLANYVASDAFVFRSARAGSLSEPGAVR